MSRSPYTAIEEEKGASHAWSNVFSAGNNDANSYGSLAGQPATAPFSGKKEGGGGCCSKGVCSSSPAPSILTCNSVVRVSEASCCSTGANGVKQCTGSAASSSRLTPSPLPSSIRARDGGPVFSLTWLTFAIAMAWFSVVWSLGEGGAGLYVGIKHAQMAVLANAGQSGCEVISAILVLWRLQADSSSTTNAATSKATIIARERIGIRFMGLMFCALGLAVIGGCIPRFITRDSPSNTLPGLIVSAAAAFAMIILYGLKKKAARKLDSVTLLEDANCCLFCFKLSCLVILGSLLHMYRTSIMDHCAYRVCDLWWVDATLACGLSLVIIRDGIRSIRMSYAVDFEGGCGCCAGDKKKKSVVNDNNMIHPSCEQDSQPKDEETGEIQEELLLDETASPPGSGSSVNLSDEEDDIYAD